jgi:hypothetical protein
LRAKIDSRRAWSRKRILKKKNILPKLMGNESSSSRKRNLKKKLLPKFMGNESSSSSRLSIVPTNGITLQIQKI